MWTTQQDEVCWNMWFAIKVRAFGEISVQFGRPQPGQTNCTCQRIKISWTVSKDNVKYVPGTGFAGCSWVAGCCRGLAEIDPSSDVMISSSMSSIDFAETVPKARSIGGFISSSDGDEVAQTSPAKGLRRSMWPFRKTWLWRESGSWQKKQSRHYAEKKA